MSSPLDAWSEPSMELLRRSGLDLERTRREGVDSAVLSAVLQDRGWLGAAEDGVGGRRRPGWVTFHGIYDVAYLVKLLTGSSLPKTLAEFVHLVGKTLGSVFDAKYVVGFRQPYGAGPAVRGSPGEGGRHQGGAPPGRV